MFAMLLLDWWKLKAAPFIHGGVAFLMMPLLEECNPVALVLILMLVLVGGPSTGACGSENLFY
jgi:hypothetical protein